MIKSPTVNSRPPTRACRVEASRGGDEKPDAGAHLKLAGATTLHPDFGGTVCTTILLELH